MKTIRRFAQKSSLPRFCLLFLVFLLITAAFFPAAARAEDVIINNSRTSTVKLDELTTTPGWVHVTSTGKVDIPSNHKLSIIDANGIVGLTDGWKLTIDKGGLVNTEDVGGSGVCLGSAVLENNGTVSSSGIYGVYVGSSASQVTNSGVIMVRINPYYPTVALSVNDGSIFNTGTISSGGGIGLYLVSGTVVNSGSIAGSISNAARSVGVRMDNGTVENTGTITSGGGTGLYLASGTVVNSGSIAGSIISYSANGVGVRMDNGTVENTGTITGYRGVDAYGSAQNYAEIINSGKGLISGNKNVGIYTDYGNIHNLGKDAQITSAVGYAVVIGRAGTVENEGTITGPIAGIYCVGRCNVINSGTIRGNTGVYFETMHDTILDNSGTITGDGGTAVVMGDGNDTVIVRKGAVFNGNVEGGRGGDTLAFYDAGTQAGSGYKNFLSFESLGFLGGSTTLTGDWDFSGGSTAVRGAGTVMNLDTGASLQTRQLLIGAGGAANIIGKAIVSNYTLVDGGGAVNVAGTTHVSKDHPGPGNLNTNTLRVGQNGLLNTVNLDIGDGGAVNVAGTTHVSKDHPGPGNLNTNTLSVGQNGLLNTVNLDIGDGGAVNVAGKTTVGNWTQVRGGGALNLEKGGTFNTVDLVVGTGGAVTANGDMIVSREVYNEGSILSSTYKRSEMIWIKDPFGTDILVESPLPSYALELTGNGSVANKGSITGYSGILFGNGANVLDNSGTITATRGVAADMGAGDDTVIVRKGAVFNGNVEGGEGRDTLAFYDAGTQASSGYKNFLSFENLGFLGGSTTLTGDWDFSGGSTTVSGAGTVMNLDTGASLQTRQLLIGTGGAANIIGKAIVSDYTLVDGGGALNIKTDSDLTTNSLWINGGTADIDGKAKVNTDTIVLGSLTVNQTGSLDSVGLIVGAGGRAAIAGQTTVSNYTLVNRDGTLNIKTGGDFTTNSLQIKGGVADIDGKAKVNTDTIVLTAFSIDQTGMLNSGTLGIGTGGNWTQGGTLNIKTNGDFTTNSLQILDGAANIDGKAKVNTDTIVFGSLNVNQSGTLDTDTLGIGTGGTANIAGTTHVSKDRPGIGNLNANTLNVGQNGLLNTVTLDIVNGGVANIAGKTTVGEYTVIAKGGSLNVNQTGSLDTGALGILPTGIAAIDGTAKVREGIDVLGSLIVNKTGSLKVREGIDVLGSLIVNKTGSLDSSSLGIGRGGIVTIDGTTHVSEGHPGPGNLNTNTLSVGQNGLLNTVNLDIGSGGAANIAGTATVSNWTQVDGDGALNIKTNGDLTTNSLQILDGAANIDGKAKVNTDTIVLGSLTVNQTGSLDSVDLIVGTGGRAAIAGRAAISDWTLVNAGGALDIKTGGTFNTVELVVGTGGAVTANGTLIASGHTDNRGTIQGTTNGGYALQVTGDGTVTNKGTISGYSGVLFGGGANLLDNYGTITGSSGRAANMGAGDDTVIVRSGAVFNGIVDGGEGMDTLRLENTGSIRGAVLNFEIIKKTGSGTSTVDGDLKSGKEIYLLDGGTLRVNGQYTQEKNSSFIVGFTDGVAGKISAQRARIDGGIVITPGYIREGRYVLLETAQGLTGNFDELRLEEENQLGRYLKYKLDNTGDSKAIAASVQRSRYYIEDARTRNEKALAGYLDGIYNKATGALQTVLADLNKGRSIEAVSSQLTGVSHTAFAAIDQARQTRFFRTLLKRDRSTPVLETSFAAQNKNPFIQYAMTVENASDTAFFIPREDRPNRPGELWIRGFGTSGDGNGDDIPSQYHYTLGGLMTGQDFFVAPNLSAGFAFGCSKTTLETNDLQNNGGEESFQSAFYGSYDSGRWYLDAALSYASNRYETARSIAAASSKALVSYSGNDLSGYAEGGYRFDGGGLQLTPFLTFLALRTHRDGFTETGADTLNLVVDSAETTSLQGALGVRVSRKVTLSKEASLSSELSARWIHEFGDTETMLNTRFAGTSTESFTVYSDEIKRNTAAVSLGMKTAIGNAWSFFAYYDGQFRSDQTSHAVTGGVQFRW